MPLGSQKSSDFPEDMIQHDAFRQNVVEQDSSEQHDILSSHVKPSPSKALPELPEAPSCETQGGSMRYRMC